MPGPHSILRRSTILAALLGVASAATAQRVVLPDRIAWKDEFGGSKFARSLHELSERGELDAKVEPQFQLDHDYIHTYSRPWYHHGGHSYRYWDPYDDYRYRYPFGVDGRLRYGVQPGSRMAAPVSPPPVQIAPPPEPLTSIEQARLDFEADNEDEAIRNYRAHISETPDDFEAAAELAAALIAAGRVDDGVAMIRLAYGSDPGLASRPISERILLGSRAWRGLVVRAVKHAHKRETASAWLAVSVLMQAEGRGRVGARMLERAERRGLDRAVASPLAAAMR